MTGNVVALAKLLHSERCIVETHSNPQCLGKINTTDRAVAERVIAEIGAGPRMIRTATELAAAPVGIVVRSHAGTIACRDADGNGGVFGSDLTFDWSLLALPAVVLWECP